MALTHPHADATYKIIGADGGPIGVEVSIPDTLPTVVTGFATKAQAEAWMEGHRSRTAARIASGEVSLKARRRRFNQR